MGNEEAFEIIRKGRDSHFDPKIVETFFDRLDKILEIQKEYQEGKVKTKILDIDRLRY